MSTDPTETKSLGAQPGAPREHRRYLTVDQVAAELQLTPFKVRRLMKYRGLPSVELSKDPNDRRVLAEDLELWVKAQRQGPDLDAAAYRIPGFERSLKEVEQLAQQAIQNAQRGVRRVRRAPGADSPAGRARNAS